MAPKAGRKTVSISAAHQAAAPAVRELYGSVVRQGDGATQIELVAHDSSLYPKTRLDARGELVMARPISLRRPCRCVPPSPRTAARQR